jgi:PKHD-type hydroxylase
MAWLFHLDTVENYATALNVFTPLECETIKQVASTQEKKIAGVVDPTTGERKIDLTYRKNSVVWLDDNTPELQWMYRKLTDAVLQFNQQFFKFDLFGFCERIQFTEYTNPDDFYGEHFDKILYGVNRKLSVVVQLTNPSEYEGCELKLNVGSKLETAPRAQGSVIVFPSYLRHQVTPLISGTRHSLVAWIAGPNFK